MANQTNIVCIKKLFCVIVVKAVVHTSIQIIAFNSERIVKSDYFCLCSTVFLKGYIFYQFHG